MTPVSRIASGQCSKSGPCYTRRPHGLSRYIIDPDIEAGAFGDDLYDTLTSPRRGGERFVFDEDRAWTEVISSDKRTMDQYVHDSLTRLIRIVVSAEAGESRRIVGSRQPSMRFLVTKTALDQPLFSTRHQLTLAAAQGGCMFGDCDRPPVGAKHITRNTGNVITARRISWTEFCCAVITTCSFTTRAVRSCGMTRDCGSFILLRLTRNRDGDSCHRRVQHFATCSRWVLFSNSAVLKQCCSRTVRG